MSRTRSGNREASIAHDGRVKMHVFRPSMRRIMTVVGRGSEHWVAPESGFCSCRAFYFAMTGGRTPVCYHLRSVRAARDSDVVDTIHFDDSEFDGFVRGLVASM